MAAPAPSPFDTAVTIPRAPAEQASLPPPGYGSQPAYGAQGQQPPYGAAYPSGYTPSYGYSRRTEAETPTDGEPSGKWYTRWWVWTATAAVLGGGAWASAELLGETKEQPARMSSVEVSFR